LHRAEIEPNVLTGQFLKRKVANIEIVQLEFAACGRPEATCRHAPTFTAEDTGIKPRRHLRSVMAGEKR